MSARTGLALAILAAAATLTYARNLDDYFTHVHPADRDALAAAAERSAREGTDLAVDYRVLQPDGTVLWVSERGRIFFDDHGRPLHMTGAITDINAFAPDHIGRVGSTYAGISVAGVKWYNETLDSTAIAALYDEAKPQNTVAPSITATWLRSAAAS